MEKDALESGDGDEAVKDKVKRSGGQDDELQESASGHDS
jgi:hypothetical protein